MQPKVCGFQNTENSMTSHDTQQTECRFLRKKKYSKHFFDSTASFCLALTRESKRSGKNSDVFTLTCI